MPLNNKIRKKIRRFGKLRFAGDIRYREQVLFNIYEFADPEKKQQLEDEMTDYFHAIQEGKLKPGDSILKLAIPDIAIAPEAKLDEAMPQ